MSVGQQRVPGASSSLIAQIREAFRGVSRPSHFAHCEQCELWVASIEASNPTSWESLPDSVIAQEHAALTAVTASGWVFLVPAYMTWYLRNSEISDSNTVEHLVYQLGGPSEDEHVQQCHQALSDDQRRAVSAFLEFIQPRLSAAGEQQLASIAQQGALYWL